MCGSRGDGTRHLMRGVIIFGVNQGQAAWARFYLEPVEEGGADIDRAVSTQVSIGSKSAAGPVMVPPRAES
jgi:hypothetical protein